MTPDCHDDCAYFEACIESCIDCRCATCVRHDAKDDCGLGYIADMYESEEAESHA